MRAFRHMHLEVFRHEKGDGMVALYARDPTIGDFYTPMTIGYPYKDTGLSGLSIYFSEEEFFGLLDGKIHAHNDCAHNVRRFCELYTFFDMEYSAKNSGVMQVPFVNMQIPHYVARILKRAVKATLKRCEPGGERLQVDLPWATRDRWMRHYGQATGKVAIEVDERCRDAFDTAVAAHDESFDRCIDNLQRIAKNGTYRHTETGTVKLFHDHAGFYFCILAPDGRRTLNGGVINHGRDGKQDWSTHT